MMKNLSQAYHKIMTVQIGWRLERKRFYFTIDVGPIFRIKIDQEILDSSQSLG